jgi:hypothetical protein
MIDLSTSFFYVIVFKIPKFICISLICQNQVSSFTYDFKHLSISISMFSKNILFFVMVTLTIIVPWVSSKVNVQYFISISWSFSNNWFKLNILLFIVWDIINITNKLMTVIFHLNQNRTFFFYGNLWMICKCDITSNWFIKLHKLVFVSIHVIASSIV